MPGKIPDLDYALELHENYMSNPQNGVYTPLCAISLKETLTKLLPEKSQQVLNLFVDADFDSIVCYFARYGGSHSDMGKRNKNTLLVQKANFVTDTEYTVLEGEIYNFGGVKPPTQINGEQIEYVPPTNDR